MLRSLVKCCFYHSKIKFISLLRHVISSIYYIDKSVFVENRPLVKFIRNYIRDLSGVFSISSLLRISMTSFPALTPLFGQKYSWLYNKKKDTLWLEDMNLYFLAVKKQYFTHSMHLFVKYCFYHLKVKFISLRRCVISSIIYQSPGKRGVLGSIFAGYVLLASPTPYSIIHVVYSLADLL